jgi:hypothetical protein
MMSARYLVPAFVVVGLIATGGSASGQTVAVTPTPPTPIAGGPNHSFSATGSYTLGAGQTVNKVVVKLGYYNAQGQWQLEQSKNATLGANNQYSVSFNNSYDPNKTYFMRAELYVTGNANPVANAETEVPDGNPGEG